MCGASKGKANVATLRCAAIRDPAEGGGVVTVYRVEITGGDGVRYSERVWASTVKEALACFVDSFPLNSPGWQSPGWTNVSVVIEDSPFIIGGES